jgi:aspartate kinase
LIQNTAIGFAVCVEDKFDNFKSLNSLLSKNLKLTLTLLYIPLDILTIRLHKQLNKVKVILKQVNYGNNANRDQ